jgi:E3 ubiquitin-protein ligase SHPRH
MITASIPFVIELGMNLINTELDIPDETIIRNSTESFLYESNTFYSQGIGIGHKVLEKIDDEDGIYNWVMYINGKTAKLGDYHNETCSKHINMLIRYCKSHPHYKDNYCVINKNGNIIRKKKNTGEKYYGIEKYECPICYDEFYKGKKLGCNHIFCKSCISQWLKQSDECPYCKTSIYTGEPI